MISQVALLSLVASMAAAQTLNIPTRSGNIVSLPEPSTITGKVDFANKEFDRGQPSCCQRSWVGVGAFAGLLCLPLVAEAHVKWFAPYIVGAPPQPIGATLTNVWFRDVCEDAVSVLGTGDALIVGGGAQEAKDKVIQHK